MSLAGWATNRFILEPGQDRVTKTSRINSAKHTAKTPLSITRKEAKKTKELN